MAKHETSWILELVDHITKPLREATKATQETRNEVDRVTAALGDMDDETRAVAERSLKSHQELSRELQEEQNEIKKLTNWLEELGDKVDPLTKAQIDFRIKQAQTKARRYEEQLVEINHELKEIETGPDPKKLEANWGAAVVVANQTAELIDKAVSNFDFAVGIEKTRTQIARMTGAAGNDLDELTASAHRLGRIYEQDPVEIARAANAMTKLIGGTYEENFALIEAGYQKGANINGDFLDQLKEYPTFIKQLGLTQAEAIALTAEAGKQGIYSDKALDALKEADLSLREMGPAQVDALKAVGLEVEDLAGKTSFEAVRMISEAMDGATVQAKQLVLADIFKGAGEDSGLAWIEGLDSVNMDINSIPSIEEAGSTLRGWLASLESSFSDTFGEIVTNASELSGVTTFIASMIPIVKSLSTVTWIQSAATKAAAAGQWLLNVAMNANPIGLIIAGVVALVALIVSAINHFDSWGSTILAFLGPIGMLISGIMMIRRHWDSIVEAFKSDGIIGGLKRIGIVLLDVLMHPLERILGWVGELTGWEWAKDAAGSVSEFRKEMGLLSDEETKSKEVEQKSKPASDYDFATLGGDAPKLDGINNDKTKGASSGTGTGQAAKALNVTLTVNNNFAVKDGADFMSRKDEILNYIVGRLNDTMKDALIAAT